MVGIILINVSKELDYRVNGDVVMPRHIKRLLSELASRPTLVEASSRRSGQ